MCRGCVFQSERRTRPKCKRVTDTVFLFAQVSGKSEFSLSGSLPAAAEAQHHWPERSGAAGTSRPNEGVPRKGGYASTVGGDTHAGVSVRNPAGVIAASGATGTYSSFDTRKPWDSVQYNERGRLGEEKGYSFQQGRKQDGQDGREGGTEARNEPYEDRKCIVWILCNMGLIYVCVVSASISN